MIATAIMNTTTSTDPVPSSASKLGFRPIISSSGKFLLASNTHADYNETIEILSRADLRPLNYREALLLFMNDGPLRESLKGRWFYIEGKGMDKEFKLYTINETGELTGLLSNCADAEKRATIPADKIVRVWNGPNPLSLSVLSNNDITRLGRGYDIDASDGAGVIAPIILGVTKDWTTQSKLDFETTLTATNGFEPANTIRQLVPDESIGLLRVVQEQI